MASLSAYFAVMLPRRLCSLLLLALLACGRICGFADVVINELVATGSDRLLQWSASGVPRLGTGSNWYEAGFSDALWETGSGPLGFGAISGSPTAIATNLETRVRYLTPTTYLRKTFNVSAVDAARADQLQLVVEYNDGFVAYLNGVEVARRNAGPAKKLIYHDQPAYNREVFSNTAPIPTTRLTETINLGPANIHLLPTGNLFAVHLLNTNSSDPTFYWKANLQIIGTPAETLVAFSEPWKYFPGVVEPSGNLYDPTLLSSGKLSVLWGQPAFDDLEWLSATGPIGAGGPQGIPLQKNLGIQVIGVTPSFYQRKLFTPGAAQVADALPLKLMVTYDDGFIAYLNGVEVARRRVGVPNTFTPHDATADSDSTSTTSETILIDPANKVLVNGPNVLAIQVHNFAVTNSDIGINAALQTNAGQVLVPGNTTWKYLIGTDEPVPTPSEEEEDSTPEGPDSSVDWLELHNNGAADVSLLNWRLSDDPAKNDKWVFSNVTIPAGGYLVVICDELDITAPAAGGYLHTDFKLDADGEFIGLYNASGASVSQISPMFPAQLAGYSYARDGGGVLRYSDLPTPGAANGGSFYNGLVAAPEPSVPGRFHTGSVAVSLSSTTPGATMRYTENGSDPIGTSPIFPASRTYTTSTVLRARAFLANSIPSDIVTHTYLLNQTTARKGLPAVCLTGDESRTFYRPYGILAIVPNDTDSYTGGIWSQFTGNTAASLNPPNVPPDNSAYNAPMQSGRPAERPAALEVLHNNATADLRTVAGLRPAGSPHARPRYVLTNQNSATPNSQSPWTSSFTQKPQLNVFFRDELGGTPIDYPFVPISPITGYENLRLRAGKNDLSNPFIRDEYLRRLFVEMGQVSVLGDFVNVYVNAAFKGYFNLTQRPREPFFQEARGTGTAFDVRNITVIVDGDTLAYNDLMNFARTSSFSSLAAWQDLRTRFDVVNFCDYLIVNVFAAMADWPHNNYVMDRERSTAGAYRFSIWDAEGGFGGFGRNPGYPSFNDLISTNVSTETVPARLLYTQLRNSAEFRLLFADRIQKHLFDNGALTDANLQARYNELKTLITPMIQEVQGASFSEFLPDWLLGKGDTTRLTLSGGATGSVVNTPSRRTALFTGYFDDPNGGGFVAGFFPSQALWPAALAPNATQAGSNLTLTNPNGNGTIYYTIDGSDPRAPGGAPQGAVYSTPIAVAQTTTLHARVRKTNGEWSPLREKVFTVPQLPQIVLTEIMYDPPKFNDVDGDEFEFVELRNLGTQTVQLNGLHFSEGISYTHFQPARCSDRARLSCSFGILRSSTRSIRACPYSGSTAHRAVYRTRANA